MTAQIDADLKDKRCRQEAGTSLYGLLDGSDPQQSAAYWALQRHNVVTAEELVKLTGADVLAIDGIGAVRLAKVRAVLASRGLQLRREVTPDDSANIEEFPQCAAVTDSGRCLKRALSGSLFCGLHNSGEGEG